MYKPSPSLARLFYIPGVIYLAGVCLRNRAFDAGFLHVRSLTRPVVSIGNLTLGGTGKTPFVIYLAGLLKEMDCGAAVLTRGYGRRKSEKNIVLQPGENVDLAASRIGDEPMLIRRRLPEAWLGVSSNRFCAANAIAQHREFDERMVFIMDDGFQHRGIRRDLDVVMIDPAQPPYTERLFPAGGLREPVSELRRAHVIVINGTETSGGVGAKNTGVDTIIEGLRKYAPNADFFHCIQRIKTVIPFSVWLGCHVPRDLPLQPGNAFLVAAIGNPARFRQDVQGFGIEIRGCAFFRDHSEIDEKGWEKCVSAARKTKAEAIIITEKDAVKISRPPDYPLLVAIQNTELPEAARFRKILRRCIRGF